MRQIWIACVLMFVALPLYGQAWTSGPEQVALVEVFTSEGCSSCPPTDKWLSALKKHDGLFKTFVPVGEHVDYWNYLGWDDEYSDTDYSGRQRQIARTWKKPSVYTPAVIVNGGEYRSRSTAFTRPKTNTGTLTATYDKTKNTVGISFKSIGKGKFEVFATRMLMGVETKVKRGENAGRKLKHDFVSCKLVQIDLKTKDNKRHTGKLTLPACAGKGKQQSIAVWVVPKGKPTPIQAVGGFI